MSIIGDDIWDKFEFVDNNVNLLLASFSKSQPTKDLIETEIDNPMGASRFDSTKELEGFDDVINPMCPDCLINGNCKRKHAKQVNLHPTFKDQNNNGRKNIGRPIIGNGFYLKKNVKNERKQKLVPTYDQMPNKTKKTYKKRGKYLKKGASSNHTENSVNKVKPKIDQSTIFRNGENNNNDLYCYEQLNFFNLKADDQQRHIIHSLPNICSSAPVNVVLKIETLAGHNEIPDGLKVPRNPLSDYSSKEALSKPHRSTREGKNLRNQQDRERKMKQDKGFRELSRLVPQLSTPEKIISDHQKKDILRKTANYCTLLANWSEVLGREEEDEKMKNVNLRHTLMVLSEDKN